VKKLIVLGALMMATTSAYASSDSLLYAGAALGQTEFGDGAGSDTLMGVRAGTGILPFIDVEGGYMKLGELDGTGGASLSTVYVAAKPTLTLGIADVYARFGLHKWDVSGGSWSDDSTDLMYGIGVDYYLSDSLSVGASYTRYKFDGDTLDGEADAIAINATFHL
jgi:opacity protein-like surface antigen